MALVSVSQVKIGDKIGEDVITRHGNVLFKKGLTVSQRDFDILRAFLIPSVVVEGKEAEAKTPEQPIKDASLEQGGDGAFLDAYNSMIALIKKTVRNGASGPALPILELRNGMERLIAHIGAYQPLTFVPAMVSPDDYLLHNSVTVAITSYQLARWHGFQSKDWMPIALGGLLHDIGNAKVDTALLYKPGKLTAAEVEEVRKHTLHGYAMLKSVAALNEGAKLCALQHHEREDGSGYPLALKGEKIHPYAKVVAVADIFHAMTGYRSYKKAESPYLVLEQLQKESFGKLDPALVATFINKMTELHHGTKVQLSDGRTGEIVFTDRSHPTRPMVQVDGAIVNLALERKLHIQEVIQRL